MYYFSDNEQIIQPEEISKESSAQLLLRLPGGKTMQLSSLPFIKETVTVPTETPSPKEKLKQSILNKNPKDIEINPEIPSVSVVEVNRKRQASGNESTNVENDEMRKERNRAAAQRSRAKKKRLGNQLQEENRKLLTENKLLRLENKALKEEIVKLKSVSELHRNCEISQQERNQIETTKFPAQIKIVTLDPKDVLRQNETVGTSTASVAVSNISQSQSVPNTVHRCGNFT